MKHAWPSKWQAPGEPQENASRLSRSGPSPPPLHSVVAACPACGTRLPTFLSTPRSRVEILCVECGDYVEAAVKG